MAPAKMVFALDKDSGELLVLSSPLAAAEHCKPIDVKDGYWRFYADDGSPLEPIFEDPSPPPDELDPGPFALQRAMSGLWLQERLEQVRRVRGGGLATVAEVDEVLKVNRSQRIPGLARRR